MVNVIIDEVNDCKTKIKAYNTSPINTKDNMHSMYKISPYHFLMQ